MKIRSAFVALTLAVSALLVAPSANAVSEPVTGDCTVAWLTAPSFEGKVYTGKKRCLYTEAPRVTRNGVGNLIPLYSYDVVENGVVDGVYDNAFTTHPPNDGLVDTTAGSIRWLAKKYGVNVQFAPRDLVGRAGCYGGFINSVSGAYQPSFDWPGEGLIRIGTGWTTRCMEDRRTAINVFKHEASHALINRICGTTRPPLIYNAETGFNRVEEVTTAYAMKYFRATTNDGGLEPVEQDTWRATLIHGGNCG